MSKVKYYYDSETLSYRKVIRKKRTTAKYIFVFLLGSALFGFMFVFIASQYFESPKEKALARELQNMQFQYDLLNKKMDEVESVLANVYQIYKLDPNGKYDFKEEVWDMGGSLLDNFKEAINVFETKIYEELEEEEPTPKPFSQMPEVGDLIRIGNDRFGVVTASNEVTREIEFDEKTKEEMDVLINQFSADPSAGMINITNSIFGQIK